MLIRCSGFAPAPGTALYYEESGPASGTPLVLLHGSSLDTRSWADEVPAFAAAGYRVVNYDLRGFGRSAFASVPYSHADDLAALLDHLAIERAALMGLSMGGGAAINFAVSCPERVRAMILASPTLGGFGWSREFNALMKEMRRRARKVSIDDARAFWLASPLFERAMRIPAVAPRLRAIVGDYSFRHWTDDDPGVPLAPPAAERLAAIRAPALVAVGEHDMADFHGAADAICAGVPGARKRVLAGLGHLATIEGPEAFNREALDFLGAVERGAFERGGGGSV